jgi:O-antigen/teichoic acid export membrane protein
MSSVRSESLATSILRGLAWKAASQVALQVSRLVVAIMLARLLAPHQFGLAAMVLIFSSLVIVFSDLALGAALVQRRDLTEDDRSTVFWTGVTVGALMTALGLAAAGPLAAFYGEPEVKPLFQVMSISFFLAALGTTQASLLTKEMDFRALETRMMIGTFAGAAAGITVALGGHGAWAIVVQQLTVTAVSTLLLWLLSPWHPSFRFSFASLRRLGGFSANVFGQRLLFYLHRNIDNLLIGRFLGAASLGVYSVAYNVMLVPSSRLAAPLQDVLFPAFARIQDEPRRVAEIWGRVARIVGAFSIPSLAGLVVVAPDFVHVVLGDKYSAATRVLQVLAWVGLLQSLQTTNGDILQALERTSTLLRYTVVFFLAHVAAFAIGLHWGIVGVAAGYAVSSTIVEPLFAWVTARALGVPLVMFVGGLAGIVQATLAMVAVTVAARFVVFAELPPLARLVLVALVGAATYVPLCLWRAPQLRLELGRLRRVRGGTAEPAAPVLPDAAV